MANRLFFVSADQRVREMSEVNMKEMLESKLQEIVEKNPELMSRDWDENPRKLYLISREQELSAEEDAGNAFSLDHLLVDDQGVPILVEVKRSTDTRIRREVAAQMLDYASRARFWEIEKLKASFRINNAGRPDAEALFDDEEFWNRISANLRAEHFRLAFVADRIPETLRILIEFLDRAMQEIEVYGVELKPYQTADGAMLLSSHVVGNSLNDRVKPTYPAREKTAWTREAFLSRVCETSGTEAAKAAEALIDLDPSLGLTGSFGKGTILANYMARKNGVTVFQIGQAWGRFIVYLGYDDLRELVGCAGWEDGRLRNAILGIFAPETDTSEMIKEKMLWIPLRAFCAPALIDRFRELIRSFL